MRYDVLLEDDDRPHPRHLATVYAADDDAARRVLQERWLAAEPELRLQLVRVNGDRLTRLPIQTRRGEPRLTKL
jgi:hypothetical protein